MMSLKQYISVITLYIYVTGYHQNMSNIVTEQCIIATVIKKTCSTVTIAVPYRSARALNKVREHSPHIDVAQVNPISEVRMVRDVTMSFWWGLKTTQHNQSKIIKKISIFILAI